MFKSIAAALLAGLLLSASLQASGAAAEGSLSYRRVYELLYQFRSLPEVETTHLQFLGRVVALGGETPRRLLIRHEGEPIPVEVNEFGLFDIPMSPQLAQLNPRMTADPPAQVLKLGLAIVFRSDGSVPELEWLREAARQTNRVMMMRARVAPGRVPQAYGVTLRFRPEEQALVAMLRDGTWQSLEADDEGRIDLPLDDKVMAIRINSPPLVMFPLFP